MHWPFLQFLLSRIHFLVILSSKNFMSMTYPTFFFYNHPSPRYLIKGPSCYQPLKDQTNILILCMRIFTFGCQRHLVANLCTKMWPHLSEFFGTTNQQSGCSHHLATTFGTRAFDYNLCFHLQEKFRMFRLQFLFPSSGKNSNLKV